jgi:type II secretory pathway pseudopilin PulG
MMKPFFIPRLQKDKGFTLAEALLTIGLVAMVMVAMTPFIRTVYTTWNVGSRKTELQQNARVGLEMMSRFLRQAKRITGIPTSGSGDFVKLRNCEDNQTIIFYHNLPGSPYYIGNSGLIQQNDLVMRTIPDSTGVATNALLAKSLSNLRLDFKDSSAGLVTSPYKVRAIDISLSLSDPQGLIPDILQTSSIALRPEVWIDKGVWVASGNNIVELSNDNWISGFSTPACVCVNTIDGSSWVADTNNNRIKKLSASGALLVTLTGFSLPASVSVNSVFLVNGRETVWVADTNGNRIRRIYWNGSSWTYDNITGFSQPSSVSVNPNEIVNARETCWVADTNGNRIRRIYWSGTSWTYDNITGFSTPRGVAVNTTEKVGGRSTCWVADTGGSSVSKIYYWKSGYTYNTLKIKNSSPRSVSVNAADNSCWVANTSTNNVCKLSGSGTSPIKVVLTISGFSTPYFVSANPTDGSCWIADTGNNQVVKVDAEGNEEFRISGFQSPLSVAVLP